MEILSIAPAVITAGTGVGVTVAGFFWRLYDKSRQEVINSQTKKLDELEKENKEQARSQHALDVRLTGAEASLHATKNHVTGFKEDLENMRTEIRQDLRSFMDTLTQRIDALAGSQARRK